MFVVSVLVFYPLSIGPVMWFGSRDLLPQSLVPALEGFYKPVLAIMNDPPRMIRPTMFWYLSLWIREAVPLSSPPPLKTPPPIPAAAPAAEETE